MSTRWTSEGRGRRTPLGVALLVALWLTLPLLAACGGGGGDDGGGEDVVDAVAPDGGGGDVGLPETVTPDVQQDVGGKPDAQPDVPGVPDVGPDVGPDVAPDDAGAADVAEVGGEDVPPITDLMDDTGGPDPHVLLCAPCRSDEDCVAPGGPDSGAALCATEDPAEGSFCATACGGAEDCPEGYDCVEPADSDGALYCLPTDGVCDCAGDFDGRETDCLVVNEFGACPGVRACEGGTLGACGGVAPAAERCNAFDDDCDGDTDEDFVGAACQRLSAWGVCDGETVCEDGEEVCGAPLAAEEICNGADDDCDGATDEGSQDLDGDGVADCVDPDDDDDTVLDGDDNCPFVPNEGQEDGNDNDLGDACEACIDECAFVGATGCLGEGDTPWRCEWATDDDACLDRVPQPACTSGAVCAGGACVATCANECAAGAAGCVGDRPWACGEANDGDPCRERLWGAPCGVGAACVDGVCEAGCEHDCDPDDVGCDGDTPWACGEAADGDACRDLVPGDACGDTADCVDGACVDCQHECDVATSGCDEDGRPWSCGEAGDGDGCREMLPGAPCAAGEVCTTGACVGDCAHECAADDVGCTTGGRIPWACGEADDGDSCRDRVVLAPCGPRETCTDGACVELCADDCAQGERGCGADGVPWLCGELDDGDPCREPVPLTACSAGSSCVSGLCVGGCDDECALGDAGCLDDATRWTCEVDPTTTCLVRAPTACGRTEACDEVDGCGTVCTDECGALGDTGCEADGRPWICVQLDAEPCWERLVQNPCAAGTTCNGGICQSDLFAPGPFSHAWGAAAVGGQTGGWRLRLGIVTSPAARLEPAGGPGSGVEMELGPYGTLRSE